MAVSCSNKKILSVLLLTLTFGYSCVGTRINIDTDSINPEIFVILLQSTCLNLNVIEMDTTLDVNSTSLAAFKLNLNTVPQCLLGALPELVMLNLTGCNIQYIESWNFANGRNLKELTLSHNSIERIPSEVFTYLENLISINLTNNEIIRIYTDSFLGLNKLMHLKLDKNRITDLPEDIFRSLNSLVHLDLTDNLLQHLKNDVFKYNDRLQYIRLGRNRIRTIGDSVFTHLHVSILDLSFNVFDDLFYTGWANILDVQNGRIKRCYLNGLVTFLIADNNEIEEIFIEKPQNLRKVSLKNNRLHSAVNLTNAVNIRFLDIIDNPIDRIDSESLSKFNDLEILFLPPTQERRIELEAFSALRNLRELYVDMTGFSKTNQVELASLAKQLKCRYLQNMINGGIEQYSEDFEEFNCINVELVL